MDRVGRAAGDRRTDVAPRAAEPGDLAGLAAIERSADTLFAPLGIVFPPGPTAIEQVIGEAAGGNAEILVAGRPPVAFAAVRPLDGALHLEQVAVHADHVRKGVGTRLLRAVLSRAGARDVTLITFRDGPWNAPWYSRHGFAEFPQERWGAGLRAHWDAEGAAGLRALGARVAMRRPGGNSGRGGFV